MPIKKKYIMFTRQVESGYDIYRLRLHNRRGLPGQGHTYKEIRKNEKVEGLSEWAQALLSYLVKTGTEGSVILEEDSVGVVTEARKGLFQESPCHSNY